MDIPVIVHPLTAHHIPLTLIVQPWFELCDHQNEGKIKRDSDLLGQNPFLRELMGMIIANAR